MSYLTSQDLIRKQPDEIILTGMDFSKWVGDSVVISSPVVTSEKYGGCDTDLAIGAPTVDGKIVEFTIAGGADQNRYRVEVTVFTDNGEKLKGDGILEVSER